MDIGAVRKALAAAAATAVTSPRLTTYGHVPDSPTTPCVFCAEMSVEFDASHGRGMDELRVTMRVLVSRGDSEASQEFLNSMLSGSGRASLKAALESARGEPGEPALSGAADDLRVEAVRGHTWYEHAGTMFLGAELDVRVIGRG